MAGSSPMANFVREEGVSCETIHVRTYVGRISDNLKSVANFTTVKLFDPRLP